MSGTTRPLPVIAGWAFGKTISTGSANEVFPGLPWMPTGGAASIDAYPALPAAAIAGVMIGAAPAAPIGG